MQKKLSLGLTGIMTFISVASFAGTMGDIQTRGGWVIGGDIGYGYLSTQEEDLLIPVPATAPASTEVQNQTHQIGSVIGGAYIGRDFAVLERLLMGFEVGYKYLGQSKYNTFATDVISGDFLRGHVKVNQQAIDFLLTGKVSIWQSLNLIGKIGPAYVRSKTQQNSNFELGGIAGNLTTDATIWRIKPEVGLGLGYTFSNNIGLNFMYTFIGGVDTNVTGLNRFFNSGPDKTPAVYQYNALTAGLNYAFG